MNRVFCFGILLAGFALCVGCGEPLDTPTVDPATESPAYEQEMTEGTETPMEAEDGAIEATEAAPAETTPAEATAPEATDTP